MASKSRYLSMNFTAVFCFLFAALASAQSNRVLVVYNARDRESRDVANYYIAKRSIPPRNACPIHISSVDGIDLKEFESHVKQPIRKCLEEAGKDKILYIVFSYRTPFALTLDGYDHALDQFVADIWDEYLPVRAATQADVQPYFGYAQSEGGVYQGFVPLSVYREQPRARQIYSVWRLDAATPALAKGLVDKALFAEAHGLSGKACFDLTGDPGADYSYGAGNWDVYQAAQFARKVGFSILEDTGEKEFGTPPAPMRCDGAALYAGWYSLNHYNDAFSWNPGAVGIHLDSASAVNPRSGPNWAANAVSKGITITSGAIGEPYLDNLPHPDQAFLYLFEGANAGDALLRSTRLLKWKIMNIGDPLYRPFPGGLRSTKPPGLEVILGLLPQMAAGDGTSAALLGVNGPAPPGGLHFSVKTDRPDLVTVPSSVSIPEAANRVQFAIQSRAVQADATTVKISVASNQLTRSNTLVLFPLLAAVGLNPSRVRGGSPASGSVALHHAAPAAGVTVTLSASGPAILSVPREVEIPAGQNTATFPIATRAATAQSANTITASYAGVNRTATLTVAP
jgi:uncharacterized protein (TIGR03790 family)